MTAIDHLGGSEVPNQQRHIRQLETQTLPTGGGDSTHAGTGSNSVALGVSATASGPSSTALGHFATASGDYSTALGMFCEATDQNTAALGVDSVASGIRSLVVGIGALASGAQAAAFGYQAIASHDQSTAIGDSALTTAANQIRLGTATETVSIPGTLSTPSARHLKKNIIPAPDMASIFPDLVEYEYIDAAGRRRIGYIADDLIGTDAERFVQFDDDGLPAGIDYLGLAIAQLARMNARVTALEAALSNS